MGWFSSYFIFERHSNVEQCYVCGIRGNKYILGMNKCEDVFDMKCECNNHICMWCFHEYRNSKWFGIASWGYNCEVCFIQNKPVYVKYGLVEEDVQAC
jgi:hypothetical protein